jgi:hypothetical protein
MVGMANYAPPDANGHSIAFDPIAFTEKSSRDSLVEQRVEEPFVRVNIHGERYQSSQR